MIIYPYTGQIYIARSEIYIPVHYFPNELKIAEGDEEDCNLVEAESDGMVNL